MPRDFPTKSVLQSYFVGFISCFIAQAIMVGIGRIDIFRIWIVVGCASSFIVVTCCVCSGYWLRERDHATMSTATVMCAFAGYLVGTGGGIPVAMNFQKLWYYQGLTEYGASNGIDPSKPLSSQVKYNHGEKVSLTFNQSSYVNYKLGGYGMFWKPKPIYTFNDIHVSDQAPAGEDIPSHVICAAPIVAISQDASVKIFDPQNPEVDLSSFYDHDNSTTYNFWAIDVSGCCKGQYLPARIIDGEKFQGIDFSRCEEWAKREALVKKIVQKELLQLLQLWTPQVDAESLLLPTGFEIYEKDDNVADAVKTVASLNNIKVGADALYLTWMNDFPAELQQKTLISYLLLFLLPVIWPLLFCAVACAVSNSS